MATEANSGSFSSTNQPVNRKPRGRSPKNKFLDAIKRTQGSEEEYLDRIVELSQLGDGNATLIGYVLQRTAPADKQMSPPISFELDTSLPYSKQIKQASKALSTGEIPLEYYNSIVSGIKEEAAVKHKDDLEKRMLEIEERLGVKKDG